MAGAIEGPISLPPLLPAAPGSVGLSSPQPPPSSPLPPEPTQSRDDLAQQPREVLFEADVDRISSTMGARLVVAFVELVLYLKGQVPFPPSTLRMMAANGRKGSSHQTKLLKSLHSLSEDLPSTLETLHGQQAVTIALVFGLGRAKCFVQLSRTDFAKSGGQAESHESKMPACSSQPLNQNQNGDSESSAQTPQRGISSRQPLREITPPPSPPVDDLASQLAAITLKPALSPEAVIRKAERGLAREIATSSLADGINLSPVGGQIYLRAPRSFRHPKWVVRQDAAKSLDAPYEAMITNSSLGAAGVEYVRIQAREAVESQTEGEDMIWWGWEGRLAGYA